MEMDPIGSLRVAARALRMGGGAFLEIQRLRLEARFGPGCPHRAVRRGHGWARRMVRGLGVELEVTGRAPRQRVLLLANHRSYIDIPVLLSQVPCAFLAKAEIGEWPLFGSAARLQHTVFVRRECKESRRRSRQHALERLQQGLTFAAFPEGTTTRGPGTLPFFPGLFELAREHDIPVAPVAIEYGDPSDAWVDDDPFLGHFLTAFRKPRVHAFLAFGPILHPREVPDLRGETERWIRARLATLPVAAPRPALRPAARPQPSAA